MSEILPAGVDDVRDAPHVLFNAIRRALVFLSFDELPEDERPPRTIWLDDEAINRHFAAVKKMRAAKYGTDGQKPIEDPVQNDAASLLISE